MKTLLTLLAVVLTTACSRSPTPPPETHWVTGTWIEDPAAIEEGIRADFAELPPAQVDMMVGMLAQQRAPMSVSTNQITLHLPDGPQGTPVQVVTNSPNLLVLEASHGGQSGTMRFGRDERGLYRIGTGFVEVKGERHALQAKLYLRPADGAGPAP